MAATPTRYCVRQPSTPPLRRVWPVGCSPPRRLSPVRAAARSLSPCRGPSLTSAPYAESFTGVENTTRVAAVGGTGTATAASAGATAAGIVAGDLVLGHIANETRGTITGDSDTTNGSWSTQVTHRSATSGTDSACVSVAGQYKIATATGAQTYNVTAVAAEWVCQCVVLQATPDPSITQAAYRWYDEGTESGAVALAAQDTAATGDVTSMTASANCGCACSPRCYRRSCHR